MEMAEALTNLEGGIHRLVGKPSALRTFYSRKPKFLGCKYHWQLHFRAANL
jgi:hypothetical protein